MRRRASIAWVLLLGASAGCGGRAPTIDPGLHPRVRAVLEQARSAVVAAPRSAEPWGRYGMLLDAHECRAAALECYRRAAEIEPAAAWHHLQAVILEADDPAGAERLYRQAIASEPPAAEPRLRLAALLIDAGRATEARAVLDFETGNRTVAGHRALLTARCEEALGRDDRARAEAEEAVRLAPRFRQVHELQARLLSRHGDRAAAEAAAAVAHRLADHPPAWPDRYRDVVRRLRVDPHREAELALAGGRAETAVDTLARLVQEHPKDWTFAADLARRHIRVGDPTAAVLVASAGLDANPDAIELRKIRAAARLILEEWAAAAADLSAAVQLRPGDAAAWSDLSFAQQQLGMIEAADSLRRAIVLAPLAAEDRVRLVELLRARGDVTAAREALRGLAAVAPGHPDLGGLEAAVDSPRTTPDRN